MTIIVLTNCPPKLRGDMTKWMAEINTGVYVGKLSARVRDELWKRICENIKVGQATMVFPAEGEQHMDFRVHNTTWEVVDFDGIKLMRRPSPESNEKMDLPALEPGFSKAAKQQLISNIQKASHKSLFPDSFVVLDVETTGLSPVKDKIIEVGCILVENSKETKRFSKLILIDEMIPQKITGLTGITNEMLISQGESIENVLQELLLFIGDFPIVCHNAAFDINFLQTALRKEKLQVLRNKVIDTLPIVRRKLDGLPNYKLPEVAKSFDMDVSNTHRALSDCELLFRILLRLNQS